VSLRGFVVTNSQLISVTVLQQFILCVCDRRWRFQQDSWTDSGDVTVCEGVISALFHCIQPIAFLHV